MIGSVAITAQCMREDWTGGSGFPHRCEAIPTALGIFCLSGLGSELTFERREHKYVKATLASLIHTLSDRCGQVWPAK